MDVLQKLLDLAKKLLRKLDEHQELMESQATKPMDDPKEVWWDNEDVMRFLKVSPRTLVSLRKDKIPYSKPEGKIYYRKSDILKWLLDSYNGDEDETSD